MIKKKTWIKEYFLSTIVICVIADIAIFLNITFLRQILGFLFLTILPGLLILRILKLNKLGYTEKVVLAVGLSVSFLMLFGLLLNNLSLSFGYETPLSSIPLLISFNLAFIVLAAIGYKVNKDPNKTGGLYLPALRNFCKNCLPNLNLTTSEKAFLIVPIMFPALSIFGMHVMNTTDNNIFSMFLLFLIPIYVAFICIFNHKFPKRLYPVVIFSISISLLLLLPLRSNHIIGIDTHSEYYLFQITFDNLHWDILGHSALDACLSITLLPTIYQSCLNVNPECFFNVFYVILFSFTPLIVFVISKRYIGESYGFLASLFYICQTRFISAVSGARTNVAILFFALAMMTLFNDKIDPLKKRILFIVFIASCMVSHYSSTYIFFFIMFGAFVGMEILSKKYPVKKVISLTIIILFFSLIFFWYSQVTETAFNTGVNTIKYTFHDFNRFFAEEIRGEDTMLMLGAGIRQRGIPSKINFVFTWLIFALIGVGIIALIRKYKEMSFPELKFKKPDFLKEKFEVEYFVIALSCSGLLVMMVMFPYISRGYSMYRLYALTAIILSSFFVIGGIIIAKCLKVRTCLIILLILIPSFFSITGVTYQLLGGPYGMILNSKGNEYNIMYVHDQESYSARWLRNNMESGNNGIYTDGLGYLRLISQAGIMNTPNDYRIERDKIGRGYIYLGYYNVVDGKLMDRQYISHNITKYQNKFVERDMIYTNAGSEVLR